MARYHSWIPLAGEKYCFEFSVYWHHHLNWAAQPWMLSTICQQGFHYRWITDKLTHPSNLSSQNRPRCSFHQSWRYYHSGYTSLVSRSWHSSRIGSCIEISRTVVWLPYNFFWIPGSILRSAFVRILKGKEVVPPVINHPPACFRVLRYTWLYSTN
jgi:hypothetical protein